MEFSGNVIRVLFSEQRRKINRRFAAHALVSEIPIDPMAVFYF